MKTATSWAALSLCLSALAATPALAELDELLSGADPARGEKLFKSCKACHTVDKGGKNRAGPNLYGVVGRPVASVEGFRYSKALKAHGGEWSVERLDAFLTKPRAEVKGTRMGYAGMKKAEDRADLIAYLNSRSDAPLPLGAQEATTPEMEEEPEFGVLKAAKGVETTYYTCTACHSEMIVAQQGLTRDGWAELIEWMVDEQGMVELDPPDLNEVLDYLATNYNEDRPNFPDHQLLEKRQFVED